jgi:molybdenum cofactor cytidylyltransferase
MIFAELPLDQAAGAILAHGLLLGGRRFPKGHAVDAALLDAARAAGLASLWVARLDAGDTDETQAATALGQALAGVGVEARPPVHGRVNLHARHDGLLRLDASGIAAANARDEALGIATLPPDTPVRAGDLVATVKVIPFAVGGDRLAAVLRDAPRIEVLPWRVPGPALLVQTLLPETGTKVRAKTAAVTRERLARLGWPLVEADAVPHGVAPLASALRAAQAAHALVLVAGATATADRRDVIPAAIDAAGGTVLRVGMPVDPGNLLVLGRLAPGATVIGLPGCARSPRRNGLDLVLERLAAALPVTADGMAAMGVGGLLEGSGTPVPWGWG